MNKNNAAAVRRLKTAFAAFQREVESLLKEIEHANNVTSCSLPEVEACIKAAASHYRIHSSEIMGRRRNADTAWARQVAVYLATQTTRYGYDRIAKCFNMQRTNIYHTVDAVKNRISTEKPIRDEVEGLIKQLTP